MPRIDRQAKAERLVREGRVILNADGSVTVHGDTHSYTFFPGEECPCKAGANGDDRCTHRMASWLMRKALKAARG